MITTRGSIDNIVVRYQIAVKVGSGTELGGARRRYREFLKLRALLQLRYPRLLSSESCGEQDSLANFPKKTILRAAWEPEVVVERVRMLGLWLTAITEKLQYVSPELISFLNVPMYCAVRMLAGDLSPADLIEPCSPDTVMASESDAKQVHGLNWPKSSVVPASPQTDHQSLHTLAKEMRNSIERPGFHECAMLLGRAICQHSIEAGISCPPGVYDAHRLVRAVCFRALFKPWSLIAAAVYLDRIRPSMRRALLHGEGWALTSLVVLLIAAKVYDSDYPISNADVCAPGLLPPCKPHAGPPSIQRVNDCERRVLSMLDYCTFVSQAEFARYYLNSPFMYPAAAKFCGSGRRQDANTVPGAGGSTDSLLLCKTAASSSLTRDESFEAELLCSASVCRLMCPGERNWSLP